MYYPHFDVPRLGGGLLIAIIAIVHVVIAHFAVGRAFSTPLPRPTPESGTIRCCCGSSMTTLDF